MSRKAVILRRGIEIVRQSIITEIIDQLKMKKAKKKRKFWIRPWISRRKVLGASDNLYQELAAEDPDDFKRRLRMSTDQFETLLRDVTPLIKKCDTSMREALSPRIKLQITLKFLATGDNYPSLAESFRVPESTISLFLKNVLDAIYQVLQEYIKVPTTTREWLKIQEDFMERWQFPFCCGAIDGKHVLIQNPPHGASDYYNYKGGYSVVLFAIVDAYYRFVYVDVGTNGRMNDAHIWKKSSFCKGLEENNLQLPDKAVFVADDAFPLTTNIMKPYSRHERLSVREKTFNYRLSRARRVVENAFGIMANRFRVFRKPISVSLDKTDSIIKTACALHNWLRTNTMYMNTPGLLDEEDFSTGTITQGSWRNTSAEGIQEITTPLSSNNYSQNAKTMRDIYAEHFIGSGKVPWQDRMIQ